MYGVSDDVMAAKKRIAKMGDGYRLRAKRRAWRKRGEERQEATMAHLLANIKDKGILRSPGEFVISSTSSSLDLASCYRFLLHFSVFHCQRPKKISYPMLSFMPSLLKIINGKVKGLR